VEEPAGASWDALLDEKEEDGSFETLRSSIDAGSEVGVTTRLCAVVFSNFIWWLFVQLAKTLSFFPGGYLVNTTFCAIFAWNIIALWMRALALPCFDKPL